MKQSKATPDVELLELLNRISEIHKILSAKADDPRTEQRWLIRVVAVNTKLLGHLVRRMEAQQRALEYLAQVKEVAVSIRAQSPADIDWERQRAALRGPGAAATLRAAPPKKNPRGGSGKRKDGGSAKRT